VGRPSLEGVYLKLERAKDHLYGLSDAVGKFLRDEDSYSMVAEFDDQRRPLLRVEHARRPPPEISILIGECVYNLHSALDHLAFQLAVANTSGRLPKAIADTSAFPIFNSGPRFRATNRKGKPTPVSGRFKIRGASPNAQAVIESLQPYHRRKKPGARVLWQLHELSNIDKHRLLHVTHSSLEGSEFRLRSADPIIMRGYDFEPGPLKAGAVVARWHVEPVAGSPLKLDVDARLVTDVTFGKESPARTVRRQGVGSALYGITAFIASEVLPPLVADLGQLSTFSAGRYIDVLNATTDELKEIPPPTFIRSLRTRRRFA
jgi:hypothetical protein